MLRRLSSFIFVLLTCSLWGQHIYPNKAEEAAIERGKTTQVASLDRGLPKVTLEFFLNYEGEGASIHWRMSSCDQLNRNRFIDRKQAPAICVEAEIDLKDARSATIVVWVGTLKTGPVGVPTFFSATVTEPDGTTHAVRRLSDLPMELHRWRPPLQWPRDLPLPAGAALSQVAAATNHNA